VSADLPERSILARRSRFADDRHLIQSAQRFVDPRGWEPEKEPARGLGIEEELEAGIGRGIGTDDQRLFRLRVLGVKRAPETASEKLDRSR
jgi:hypothetical protein